MTNRTVTITDENAPNVATVAAFDIAETIAPWFPEAPIAVIDAVHELEHAVLAGDYYGELAAYLGVKVQPA
jgi:hypothetical protein